MSSPAPNPDFVDNIEIWAWILKPDYLGSNQALPFTCCVALGKWINLSTCVLIFKMGKEPFSDLLGELNELTRVKHYVIVRYY